MMRGKIGRLLILGGSLMLMGALGLAVYNLYDGYRAAFVSRQTVVYLTQAIPQIESALLLPNIETPLETPMIPDEVEIADYALDPGRDMPVLEINGHEYIGTLSIAALELQLPVISQWSYPALKDAPCRYSGSAYTDDFVIAGHNYQAHFAALSTLNEADTICFTDIDGNSFVYVVVAKEVLSPTAIEDMTCGDWDLTLFTCTTGGSYRVAIRCDRA